MFNQAVKIEEKRCTSKIEGQATGATISPEGG